MTKEETPENPFEVPDDVVPYDSRTLNEPAAAAFSPQVEMEGDFLTSPKRRDRHVRLADSETSEGESHAEKPNRQPSRVQRRRWGTRRYQPGQGPKRHQSRLGRSFSVLGGNKRHNSENSQGKEHQDESGSTRRIYFNRALPPDMVDDSGSPLTTYPRNKIRTTKYTPLTFLPKNITFQFKNVANVYFLLIVILGAFPIFGVSSPGLAAVPIVVIVAITAIKDAIEDYRRTIMDLEVNNTATRLLHNYKNPNVINENVSLWRKFKKANTRVFMRLARWIDTKQADRKEKKTGIRPKPKQAFNQQLDNSSLFSDESIDLDDLGISQGNATSESVLDPSMTTDSSVRFEPDFWKSVRVGDFVRVHSDEEIPADLLILSTSEEDDACYVETKNLDGETNLKVRQALRCTREVRHASDCQQADFMLECEPPLPSLYSFNGVVRWRSAGEEHTEPVNINNLLLRGCTLRNTKWAIGVVVYTGMDSKIMQNAGVTPTKRSHMQKYLNVLVIYNFILLFILCLVSGLINGIKHRNNVSTFHDFEYGSEGGSPAADGVVTFWAVLILYQSLVPISLYISIEIVKTAQAFFIYSDVYMYHEPIDYPCTPKSWNISDDLGQIEYIFSDKTGTLTQNVMQFKKCTIRGVAYGKAYTEALAGLRKRQGADVEAEGKMVAEEIEEDRSRMLRKLRNISKSTDFADDELTFISSEFVADLEKKHGPEQSKANYHFMLCLALCNSVITEESKTSKGKLVYKAQSPDEAALVGTAKDVGFALLRRVRRGVVLNILGDEVEFQLLNILEFNSARKRMSVIVKMHDGRIMLICKGADSIIYDRLAPGQADMKEKTAVQLEEFANEGLRTLCVAEREIDPKFYEDWNKRHEAATAEIENREEKMDSVSDEIEHDLMLLGGTAIEDRLQDGVPRTISLLADGGIKLWVLTGDKVETAINIGFSCNLLDNEMKLLVIRIEGDDRGSVPAQIDEYLYQNFNMQGDYDELEAAKADHSSPSGRFAVVIDGDALRLAMNPALQVKFLLLCKQCRAVLCCRVSPAQKAAVVKLVRNRLEVMTLAIGDGANDVAMIQEANVGVGIAGEEGRQAVMSSDYAFGQFRFLARLLLVHGRYSYKRIAEMVPNFFYKNVVFTMTLFWYGIFSDFDGSYLYEYTYVMFFNLAFTSLPVILMGILDQDVPDRISLAVPQLYRRGILQADFTELKFWLYMLEGFYQSFVSFFFPYFIYSPGRFESKNGLSVNHRFWMGLASCTISVMACNFYVVTNQYRWDWFSSLINVISSLLVFVWTGVYSPNVIAGEIYGLATEDYGLLNFWAVVLLGLIACMLMHFVNLTVRAMVKPMDADIVREQWKIGEFDTVMATPLAADDPDAARYENPYRPDTTINKRRTGLFRKERRGHAPYEMRNESHTDILRSPDTVNVGGRPVTSEEFVWDSPTIDTLAHDTNSPQVNQSIERGRRLSRWEQPPVHPGIENIGTTQPLDNELSTAGNLLDRTTPQSPFVDNSVPQSPFVDNSVPQSPFVDNSVPQSPFVDNPVPESPFVDSPEENDSTRERK